MCEGECLAWDFTGVETTANSYIYHTNTTSGKAADIAERKTDSEFLEGRYTFTPIGVETFGPWGPSTKAFFDKLGKSPNCSISEPRSYEFLRQRLSITLQRRNMCCVVGTLGDGARLEKVSDLLKPDLGDWTEYTRELYQNVFRKKIKASKWPGKGDSTEKKTFSGNIVREKMTSNWIPKKAEKNPGRKEVAKTHAERPLKQILPLWQYDSNKICA